MKTQISFILFLLLVLPLSLASMTIETMYNLNGIGGTPYSFDCLGSCSSSGFGYMSSYNSSIASSSVGKYGVAGSYINGLVSKSFYGNAEDDWEFIFLDSKDNKIKVLQYINGVFDIVAEKSLTSDGTIVKEQQGTVFDYNGDGRDDFIFVINDSSTLKLVYYSLSSNGIWSKTIVKDTGITNGKTLIQCGNFGGIPSGYISGEGRQCFGSFFSDLTTIRGYKYDGTQTFSYTISVGGSYDSECNPYLLTSEDNPIMPPLNDINGDGYLEFVYQCHSEGYSGLSGLVIKEDGTKLFELNPTGTGHNAFCNIGYMSSTSNMYIACSSNSAGTVNFIIWDEAGNKLFELGNTASRLDANMPPIFAEVVDGNSGDEVCFMYALSADSKIHFKCYTEDGTEIQDYSGNVTIADNTKWKKQNFLNFKYLENKFWLVNAMTLINTPEQLIGIDFTQNDGAVTVQSLEPYTNLIDSSNTDKTQYKTPSFADLDCDGKIDLVASACDSDNSPCNTRVYLSSNGTSNCSIYSSVSNTAPSIYSMSTNTLANSLCLGQTYTFTHGVRDYECDTVTSGWSLKNNGIWNYPYAYFGYKQTYPYSPCGLSGGTTVFIQDINTNDLGVGNYTWNATTSDSVSLSNYTSSTLNYTVCSTTNTSCSCYAPNTNLTTGLNTTMYNSGGNVTIIYYNHTIVQTNLSTSSIENSSTIRNRWCAEDNSSLMCTVGGVLGDSVKVKSDADWMIVGLLFAFVCVAIGGYVTQFKSNAVMIGAFVVGLIVASGLGFFGTWIPILAGVLIIGGLGYFAFNKMQGRE